MSDRAHALSIAPSAQRTLAKGPPGGLPLAVAAAVTEFITGAPAATVPTGRCRAGGYVGGSGWGVGGRSWSSRAGRLTVAMRMAESLQP